MNKYKILTILGARPQFVKAASLSRALKNEPEIREIIIHTGQHFDQNMSDVFFSEMQVPHPDYRLNISGLNHGAMTGRMMEEIEKIALTVKPSSILVFGDTNSTLAGALVGAKLHIPVIHLEAGLRSFNMEMPEEINRILTDRMSSLLLCPTQQSISNLKAEGYNNFDCRVELVGDVMQDAALFYGEKKREGLSILQREGIEPEKYALLTCHRAENTDNPKRLSAIIDGINQVAERYSLVWPMHPRLAKRIGEFNLSDNIKCLDPVGYFDMIALIKSCGIVLTDSGGLQKEAYFFGKYCITLRDQTEWVELIENGFNYLVGADANRIKEKFNNLIGKPFDKSKELYGNGKAAQAIVKIIKEFLV